MSEHTTHGASANPQREHGTTESYVVGFILSLLFTIIPYLLVTNKVQGGRILLVTILAVAVLQMIIQVVFFLHLGRERNPRWQLYFFVGTVVGILTVVGGSVFIMAHLHANMNPTELTQKLAQDEGIAQVSGKSTGACQEIHTEHTVIIKNGISTPAHVDASRCDAIIFTNDDDSTRDISFGAYPQQLPYAGQADFSLGENKSQMVTLSHSGSFQFNDHLHPDLAGTFTVSQ